MDMRRRVNQIAVSQHSLVTLEQALGAGLTIGQVRRRARSGEWLVVRRRVYAVAGARATWEQSVAAATLSLAPGAWASHATAGRLWGLPGVEPDEIDVLVPLDRRVKLAGVRSHRTSALFTADLRRVQHIPVTSAERTIVDLSASVSFAALGRMVDEALRRRVVRLDRLGSCVGRLAGSPGRRPALVQELLAERLPGYDPGDSDLETRVLRTLVANRLPAPVQQHRVRIGGRSFRIDLAYPDSRIAVELDGWAFHNSRSSFDDDRSRANRLVASGWTVLRFTSRSSESDIVRCVDAALSLCGRSGVA